MSHRACNVCMVVAGDYHDMDFARLELLLEARCAGRAEGFVEDDWPSAEPRPGYYINRVGAGEVLYLNSGTVAVTTTCSP